MESAGGLLSSTLIGCGKSVPWSMSFSRAKAFRATVSNAFSTLIPSLADVSKYGILDLSRE